MMSFSEDIDFVRSTSARIASYLVSILDAGKAQSYGMFYLFPSSGFKLQANSSSRLARNVVHAKDPPANVIRVHIQLR